MLSIHPIFAGLCGSGSIRQGWVCFLIVVCTAPVFAAEQPTTEDVSPSAPMRLPSTLRQPAFEPLPSGTTEVRRSPLALVDIEELARRNNPTLSAALANVDVARGRQVQAGLYPNPTIGYTGMEMGDQGTAGQQGAFVTQQFITGGKRRLDRAVAGQEIQEAQFRYSAQELRVLSDVRMRFYDVLVAQRRIELTGELVGIGKKSTDLSRALLTATQISQNDLLQAEIEAEEAGIVANNAGNQRVEAWRRLAAAIGMPTLEEQALDGQLDADLPAYEWEVSYLRILKDNPQLAAAQARVQRARFLVERARRESIPNVDVMASAFHINQSGSDAATVQVGIPLPIFNRNQGNIMQAEAELIAAENDVRRIELNLQERLAMAYRSYANSRQQADRYKNEILPRAKQSIELVTRAYGAGQLDFLAFLTSQRTYIRVNLAYLDALAELRRAATLIEGQLLSDSLQTESMGNLLPQ